MKGDNELTGDYIMIEPLVTSNTIILRVGVIDFIIRLLHLTLVVLAVKSDISVLV